MGIFDAFVDDRGVRLIGVEAGGRGIRKGQHAARFAGGAAGVLQGTRSFVLQDEDGNIELTHSISAGLDYAAIGPEHAALHESGRAEYTWIDDDEALAAFQRLGREEGILPALESSHAIAHACRLAPELAPDGADDRQPVGPRRQGRPERPEGAGGTLMGRLADTFARLRRREARRAGRVRHRRRSGSRGLGGDPASASPRAARTSSRSACRSRIRWPTAR